MKHEYRVQIAYAVYTGKLTLNFVVVSTSTIGALQAALREAHNRASYYSDNILGVTRVTIKTGKLLEG